MDNIEDLQFLPFSTEQSLLNRAPILPIPEGYPPYNYVPPIGPYYNPAIYPPLGPYAPIGPYPIGPYPIGPFPPTGPGPSYFGGKNNWAPNSPPPNYIPSKRDKGVKSVNSNDTENKKTNYSTIKFCLYKFTYIWENNGRSYWAFLLNIDQNSLSGFRWLGRNWVYFGIDLKKIDSFICYFDNENKRSNIFEENINAVNIKEYSLNKNRYIHTIPLTSVTIPETINDYITEMVGNIDEREIYTKTPCMKSRTCCYNLFLEISLPNSIETPVKEKIIELSSLSIKDALSTLSLIRSNDFSFSPIDNYYKLIKNASSILKEFSYSFKTRQNKFVQLKNYSNEIYICLKDEKITTPWASYI